MVSDRIDELVVSKGSLTLLTVSDIECDVDHLSRIRATMDPIVGVMKARVFRH